MPTAIYHRITHGLAYAFSMNKGPENLWAPSGGVV